MMTKRKLLWCVVAVCLGGLVWAKIYSENLPETFVSDPEESRPFFLILGDDWSGPEDIDISYNDPVEFDGLTREAVMALRGEAIEKQRELISGPYEYSEAVFGQIEDGLPWWGIEGQMCQGPGQNSIDGASEESRFLLNPFLLLMANNSFTFPNKLSFCEPVIPGPPLSAKWFPGKKEQVLVYDMAGFLSRRTAMQGHETTDLAICALNARDFGYNYVYYDPECTFGVTGRSERGALTEVYRLRSYIHKGGSCKYPGGCNNGSPDQAQLDVIIQSLPAQICARLWRHKPETPNDPADVTVKIFMN